MNKKTATNNTRKFTQTLIDLFFRWLDENEFEDIKDYLKVMQKVEPRAIEMTTEPFGVKVRIEDKIKHFFINVQEDKLSIGIIE
jgi:hypothetical protein